MVFAAAFVKKIKEYRVNRPNDNLWAADVKLEIHVLAYSLKSNIISSSSFQLDNAFWSVGSTLVKQLQSKASTVAQGHGKFYPGADPKILPKQTFLLLLPKVLSTLSYLILLPFLTGSVSKSEPRKAL